MTYKNPPKGGFHIVVTLRGHVARIGRPVYDRPPLNGKAIEVWWNENRQKQARFSAQTIGQLIEAYEVDALGHELAGMFGDQRADGVRSPEAT